MLPMLQQGGHSFADGQLPFAQFFQQAGRSDRFAGGMSEGILLKPKKLDGSMRFYFLKFFESVLQECVGVVTLYQRAGSVYSIFLLSMFPSTFIEPSYVQADTWQAQVIGGLFRILLCI